MGLAEPRKRLKISHDPNNTAWSTSTDSYGQRLMLSQGWKAGERLGARNRARLDSSDDAKLTVSFKDDNLGLGASLMSKDIEHSRTGLDAFQGLLGRLNGKSDAELEVVEKKIDDRKLAMFTQGRWGAMIFVPGGLLVQRDEFRAREETTAEEGQLKTMRNDADAIAKAKRKNTTGDVIVEDVPVEEDEAVAKARRKEERAEKRQRKEERRRRKAEKPGMLHLEPSNEVLAIHMSMKEKKKKQEKKQRKRNSSLPTEFGPISETGIPSKAAEETRPARSVVRNGRQLLRGRYIEAKKMAVADAKMLDEIFMRTS